jgi:uncharacterized glyoxalase superfamily protein PhnB
MAKLSRIAPELPAANLREAIDYYQQKLGFELVSEMPNGDYAIVERDDIAIHLFHDDSRVHSPAGLHLFTHDLDELHAEFVGRGAVIAQHVVRKPWGNRDFRLRDPSGNELKFTEPL